MSKLKRDVIKFVVRRLKNKDMPWRGCLNMLEKFLDHTEIEELIVRLGPKAPEFARFICNERDIAWWDEDQIFEAINTGLNKKALKKK